MKVLIGAACVAVIVGVAAYIGTILDKEHREDCRDRFALSFKVPAGCENAITNAERRAHLDDLLDDLI